MQPETTPLNTKERGGLKPIAQDINRPEAEAPILNRPMPSASSYVPPAQSQNHDENQKKKRVRPEGENIEENMIASREKRQRVALARLAFAPELLLQDKNMRLCLDMLAKLA